MKTLPAASKVLLESEENVEDAVVLAEIRHESLGSEVIRLANAVINVTSKSQLYVGFPFSLEMPSTSQVNSKGRISVQNVDRNIGLFLLALRSPPQIEIIVLSTDDFDTWLMHLRRLWLRNIQGDTLTVSAEIDTWDLATEPWPSKRVVASRYPGVFWA